MGSWSKRGIVTFAALAVAWGAGLSFSATGGRLYAQGASPKPKMSEEIYKNVQVLKGIPVDEFIGTMGVFSTSLTLCCGNCHTGAGTSDPKWEDDPPRKKIARRMIQMVNQINKDNFGGRQVVTCWTCHRGSLSPAVTAPLDFAYGDTVVVPPDVLPRAGEGSPRRASTTSSTSTSRRSGARRPPTRSRATSQRAAAFCTARSAPATRRKSTPSCRTSTR